MKKVLLSILSLALIAILTVGATIAYLQVEDGVVNVMTVGNVDLELQEKQRSEDGSELVDFVQGKEITPLVGSAQGEKDRWGQPKREDASNYVDKIVYATNTGNKDAYIRFLVAIPTALIPDPTKDAAPLHWNWGNRVDITGEGKYNTVAYAESEWAKLFTYDDVMDADGKAAAPVTIDGEEYWVTYFTMQEALAPKADSLAVMAGLYLDSGVDYDDELDRYTFNGTPIDYDFSNGVKVPVLLQAVQTDGWNSADEAFVGAFGAINVANAEAWFGGVEAPVLAYDADVLAEALASGKDVVMAQDLATKELIMNDGNVFDGSNHTLDASETPLSSDCAIWTSGGTIKNLTLVGDSSKTRGIGSGSSGQASLTENLYIDNVKIDSMLYAINGSGAADASVYVTNSNIYGWVSYSGIESINFTKSTLGKGNSGDGYMVIYGTTNFTDCNFEGVFDLGAREEDGVVLAAGKTVTFTNCYYGGVKVTAENFVEYFYYGAGDERDFGNLMRECTIIVDGVTVDNSAYTN